MFIFLIGICGSFVTFCILLRWHPGNVRYLAPVMVLGCSVIGAVFGSLKTQRVVTMGAILLLLSALPFALANKIRPLMTAGFHSSATEALRYPTQSILTAPRSEVYFWDYHLNLASSYLAAAEGIRQSECDEVGVDASLQHFEYPMMALLLRVGRVRRIRYAGVENLSAAYPVPSNRQPPCAIICLNCAKDLEKWRQYQSTDWPRATIYGEIVAFNTASPMREQELGMTGE
jgi:hypothetical protein